MLLLLVEILYFYPFFLSINLLATNRVLVKERRLSACQYMHTLYVKRKPEVILLELKIQETSKLKLYIK